MENKEPKEIWVARLEDLQSQNHIGGVLTLNKVYLDSVKYIHSSEVERLLDEKDAEIEALKKEVADLNTHASLDMFTIECYREELKELKGKLQIRENLNRTANREDI